MANRVFQNVVYQMKDAVDRVVGVIDETGTVISCSELGQIGEVREGVAAVRQTAGDAFVRDGYAYHQFSNAKHNDYAVFVEGTDTTAEQFAAMLSISLQSIKQYHDEKFDKTNFIKNVVLDNILPGDIYAKARELHFVSDVQRVVLLIRVTSGNDISAYDVVSGLFPDKQNCLCHGLRLCAEQLDGIQAVGMLILEQFQRFAVAEIQRLGAGHLADGPGRTVVGHQMTARRVGQPRHRRKHRPGGDL